MQISSKQLPPAFEKSNLQPKEKTVNRQLPMRDEMRKQEAEQPGKDEELQFPVRSGESPREDTMILKEVRSEKPFNRYNNINYAFESYRNNQTDFKNGSLINLLA